jgi:hypothetical protein
MENLIYQTFEFNEEGKKAWGELSKDYPSHLIMIDFENKVFKPDNERCINDNELQLANEYANKMNQIAKTFGIRIVWKNQNWKKIEEGIL